MAKALSCCLPPAQARRFISRICCAASFTLILESIGVEKAGFHAFRRFRTTDMVAKQHAPEELIKFCLGHAASADVTDRYSKLSEDVEFRKR